MYSRFIQVIGVLVSLAFFACGGTQTDSTTEGIKIGFSSSRLSAETKALRISVHVGDTRNCVSVEHAPNAKGLYIRDVENVMTAGGQESFKRLPDGTYTVAVYGLSSAPTADAQGSKIVKSNTVVGYGCETGLAVTAGKLTSIEIMVNDR